MSLFSGFGVDVATVKLLAAASGTAMGGPIPPGFSVYSQFDDPRTGASATVLKSGNNYVLAFRGTDNDLDKAQYPLLATGGYIKLFDSFLKTLPTDGQYYVTGASLGGGAANQLADIASTAYGGKFANAKFVAFASPNIARSSNIMNFGFENDPVFKVLKGYQDGANSLDNLALANSEYAAGNYDGRHPFSDKAHAGSLELFDRLLTASFYDIMQPDSAVIFVATDAMVTDRDPGRTSTGAFYLGRGTADQIAGRDGADFLEGFGGADLLKGGAGNDHLSGGAGNDVLDGGTGTDTAVFSGNANQYTVTKNNDGSFTVTDLRANAPDGSDQLTNVELLKFANTTVTIGSYEPPPPPVNMNLVGDGGRNTLVGGDGNDTLRGNGGRDLLDGGAGTDTAIYSGKAKNYLVFNNGNGTWTVQDLRWGTSDGTDTLVNVERLQFADKTVAIGTSFAGLSIVQDSPLLQSAVDMFAPRSLEWLVS